MTQPAQRVGQIIAFRNDRLGGRLMMIVNAIRLSQLTGAPFSVHWHQGPDFSAVINDPTQFFDDSFVTQHFVDQPAFAQFRKKCVRPPDRRDLDVAGFKALMASGVNILVDEAFGFTAYPGEDQAEVDRIGAAIWTSIPLAPAITDVLATIRDAVGGKTTAYHIRRGDILTLPRAMNKAWPNKYLYDELYQTHIESVLDGGTRPILFSDDTETIARFKQRYPALIPAASLLNVTGLTPGQSDFVELLALASCDQIIAPPQSAFSTGAATLGQVPISDVEHSLSPEQRTAAANRLIDRLRDPASADQLGPGDTGQSLAHLDIYLTQQGRLQEVEQIIRRHLDAGLEISFLYPRLIELNLLDDNIEGAISAGDLMENRQIYHRPDYAKGQILHAVAHLAIGQTADCSQLANIAFWHDSTSPYCYEGMGALYVAGILNDTNALPLSPAARAMWQRPVLSLPDMTATRQVLDHCEKDALGRTLVPCIDPLTWDWSPILRAFTWGTLAEHRNKHKRAYERALAKLAQDMPGPDTASLTAIFDMHVSEKDDWLDRLIALGAENPTDATVQHRLSLGLSIMKRFGEAAIAAEAAVKAAPNVPAHVMWRGTIHIRQKRFRKAINDLRNGFDAGLAFPLMYARLATSAARLNYVNVERRAVEEGIVMAPRDIPLRHARAQFAYDSGNLQDAMADLDLLMNNEFVPATVTALRDTCLAELEEFAALESPALRKGA